MDGISEIVMSLHFGCHIGINFAVFLPPHTQKHITRGHSIAYSANRAVVTLILLLLRLYSEKRLSFFPLLPTQKTKITSISWLFFLSYKYFIFSVLCQNLKTESLRTEFQLAVLCGCRKNEVWVCFTTRH
jgi:hypothetical protein